MRFRRAGVATAVSGGPAARVRIATESTSFWQHAGLPGAEFSVTRISAHRFPPHAHDALAIGVVEEGIGRMACRGGTHLAPRGSLLLIPRGEGHTGESFGAEPLGYRMIYLSHGLLERLGFPEQLLRDVAPIDGAIAAAVRRAQAFSRRESRMAVESAVVALLDLVFARYGAGRNRRERGAPSARLHAVREYLAAHVVEDVSLGVLAGIAGCSPEHLVRSFKRFYGLAPHQWQLSLRIERARALLARGVALDAVAHASGFADASHLVRHFRRRVGQTPGGYRRQTYAGTPRAS